MNAANKKVVAFASSKHAHADDEEKASPDLRFAEHIASLKTADGAPRYAAKGGILYEWVNGFWRPLLTDEGERIAWDWLAGNAQNKAAARTATGCISAAKLHCEPLPVRASDVDYVVIPVKNGYIEMRNTHQKFGDTELWDRQLIEPTQEAGLTYQLSCEYNIDAECSRFNQFIEEVLPDSDVRGYVQEYCGYTLLPDSRFQNAQFWVGTGANGKSVLAQVIGALHERVAAMQLDALDGFKLFGLIGASLACVDETPQRINEQQLKILISGGLIQVDIKNRDPISLASTAKWLILGNAIPSISDQSTGFWRRISVIPFSAHFPESSRDSLLAGKIIKHELAGVLNWALGGLQRLLERGKFAPAPALVQRATDGGKKETNNVISWLDNNEICVDHGVETMKDEVYTTYHRWCLLNGTSPVSSEKFWKRLSVCLKTEFPEKKGGGFVNGVRKRGRVVPIRLPVN